MVLFTVIIDDVTADIRSRVNSGVYRSIHSAYVQTNVTKLKGQMDNEPEHTDKVKESSNLQCPIL